VLLALAVFFIGTAFYIPAKAMLSRQLLERAWTRTLAEHGRVSKPWPWATSWPVARLWIPRHAVDEIVQEGAVLSDQEHDRGTGLYSTVDRNSGTVMINAVGGEDARMAGNIALGESLQLQDETGELSSYRVEDLQIIDIRYTAISMPHDGKWLMLVVRFPFGSGSDDSGKRYVISAINASRQKNPTHDI